MPRRRSPRAAGSVGGATALARWALGPHPPERKSRAVTLVVTEGDGSMDRYGQLLARHMSGKVALPVTLEGTSAGAMGVAGVSARALRGLAGDAALVRRLRGLCGPLHLTNHHLGQRARARDDRRASARHRLERRKPEALGA